MQEKFNNEADPTFLTATMGKIVYAVIGKQGAAAGSGKIVDRIERITTKLSRKLREEFSRNRHYPVNPGAYNWQHLRH